jgi:hypothetical protein
MGRSDFYDRFDRFRTDSPLFEMNNWAGMDHSGYGGGGMGLDGIYMTAAKGGLLKASKAKRK